MRLWYDECDSIMAAALDDNSRLVKRKEDRALTEATGATTDLTETIPEPRSAETARSQRTAKTFAAHARTA